MPRLSTCARHFAAGTAVHGLTPRAAIAETVVGFDDTLKNEVYRRLRPLFTHGGQHRSSDDRRE